MLPADTIAAVATAPGRAGIGVVRTSGPAVRNIIKGALGRALQPRTATLCDFLDANQQPIDRGIALFYPSPHSYTGEDVLELQGHGGQAVLRLVLGRCLELGARPAEPGEFTKRAFLNDKLDLAQAESVADLIDASSAAAARGAMRSLSGDFSARIQDIVRGMTELRALVEASLDFPEEDVDFLEQSEAMRKLNDLRRSLSVLRGVAEQGWILREGTRVVLIGQPNVGKSSLLNRLAGDEVAIVTDVPGTTRDPLRHELVLNGVPVHVIDTAGLREAQDQVEQIGIERAWREIGQADMALLVIDVTQGIADADQVILSQLPTEIRKLFIFNKIDLTGEDCGEIAVGGQVEIRLSAKTGDGVDLLRAAILRAAGWQPVGEVQFMARERHLHALADAESALCRAADQGPKAIELLAEELRLAQNALGRITGVVSSDDLLGEIFSRFCIGK